MANKQSAQKREKAKKVQNGQIGRIGQHDLKSQKIIIGQNIEK